MYMSTRQVMLTSMSGGNIEPKHDAQVIPEIAGKPMFIPDWYGYMWPIPIAYARLQSKFNA